MWVITQDKKNFAKIKRFSIEKNIGGKEKKYTIIGYISMQSLSGAISCAFYPSEDSAYNEFMRLKDFMEKNPDGIYQFTD